MSKVQGAKLNYSRSCQILKMSHFSLKIYVDCNRYWLDCHILGGGFSFGQVINAPGSKSRSRGFDSRWCGRTKKNFISRTYTELFLGHHLSWSCTCIIQVLLRILVVHVLVIPCEKLPFTGSIRFHRHRPVTVLGVKSRYLPYTVHTVWKLQTQYVY